MDLARAHGMEPLAAWYLDTDCAGMFAPDFYDRLHATLQRNTANFVLLSTDLIKVLRIFRAHGIPVVPLKGPVLAVTLFNEIPWRESCDLDLLVRRADVTRAKDALMEAGYQLDSQLRSDEENAAFHWRSQLVLFRDDVEPRAGPTLGATAKPVSLRTLFRFGMGTSPELHFPRSGDSDPLSRGPALLSVRTCSPPFVA